MSKIPWNATPLERIIHEAFHEIAEKYEVDVDLVAEILEEFNDYMSRRVAINSSFCLN